MRIENNYIGYLDGISDNMATGWAVDSSFPDQPVTIYIYADGVLVGRGEANQPRPEVVEIGINSQFCGFTIPLAVDKLSPGKHDLIAKIANSDVILAGGPHSLDTHNNYQYFIDGFLDKNIISGWIIDKSNPKRKLTIELLENEVVIASSSNEAIVDKRGAPGRFTLVLPESLLDEEIHEFTFRCVELDWAFETREFQTPVAKLDVDYVPSLFKQRNNTKLSQALAQLDSKKGADLLWEADWIKPDLLKVNGAIDRFGVIPNRCGLLAGWVITQSGWEVWLADENGNTETLEAALRHQRHDIVAMFRDRFGQHTADAGFLMQWPHPMQSNESIHLLAYHPASKRAFEVVNVAPEEVSEDAEGYVRWAFTVSAVPEKFDERLNQWEGKLIETLLAERQAWFKMHSRPPEVQVLGASPEAPTISLIIPLYARWDFIEHQLLAFAQDRRLLATVEIIYVVDDPCILTAVSIEVENLYRMYEVPFKLVWGHRNRGFSGANNLGVSISRGRQVLLLNSDAFPTRPGWANRLGDLLDENPEYGLLGARLLNPEGGMQHAGMVFFYSSTWRVWLNKHPLAGLAREFDTVPPGAEIVDKPAVTGACVIMTRALFDELGGLDEGYLIGDFEDSDLCLKVIDHGRRIGYVPGIELVHLERQSFSTLGDTSFRNIVVRFNAWRHTQRWGTLIESVMKDLS